MNDAVCPCQRRRGGRNKKSVGNNSAYTRPKTSSRICGCTTGIFCFTIQSLLVIAALYFLHRSLQPKSAALNSASVAARQDSGTATVDAGKAALSSVPSTATQDLGTALADARNAARIAAPVPGTQDFGTAPAEASSDAAADWENYCDSEVPTYDLKAWAAEHGNVLPDHPAIFRDDVDREGYEMFGSLSKFLDAHGDEMVAGNPEYGQAGGFGANVPNHDVKTMSVRQMSQEWRQTHRYHSRFECAAGSFCSNVWEHLGIPKLFEGPSDSLNFLIGGPESGLPLHNHGKTWQGLVSGRKLWFLIPFGRVTMELHNTTGPYLFPLRGWAKSMKGLPLGKRPLICVQKPRDIFYFPDKWYHGTLNLDEFQLAWGGKPINRPEQKNSPAVQAINKHFPEDRMRGGDFPYSLAVRMDSFRQMCSQDEKRSKLATTELDEPLQRQKQKAEELESIVHNKALAENAAFSFCAVGRQVLQTKCSVDLKFQLTSRWEQEAREMSPAIFKTECPEVSKFVANERKTREARLSV